MSASGGFPLVKQTKIEIVTGTTQLSPCASVIVTLKGEVVGVVGVPDMSPVESIVSPSGKVAESAENVTGRLPASNCWEKSELTVAHPVGFLMPRTRRLSETDSV